MSRGLLQLTVCGWLRLKVFMRWLGITALLLAAWCGKSFVEAEAIYKDELAKLQALESEIASRREAAAKEGFDAYEQTIHRWHEEHPMPKIDRWFEPTADASSKDRQKTEELLAWEKSRDEFTESLGGASDWLEARFKRLSDEYSQRLDEQKARVKKAEQEKEAAKN